MATLSTTLVWFHRDLRCYDHEALWRACETVASGDVVIPVFIWAPEEEDPWRSGGATRWWWHESLKAFAKKLSSKNSKLILRQGPTLTALQKLIQETGATAVVWSRRYEPALIERDTHIKETLKNEGIEVHSYNGLLLNEPWTIQNQSKRPFQVFTPYWKHCLKTTPIDKPFPQDSRRSALCSRTVHVSRIAAFCHKPAGG